MTTIRTPGRLRPLASAMRITPLFAAVPMAALPGAASAATIQVTDAVPFATASGCSIVDAVASLNAAALQAGCTNSGSGFGAADTVDLSAFTNPTSIVFSNVVSGGALTLTVPATITGPLQADGTPRVTIARSGSTPFRLIRSQCSLVLDGIALNNGYSLGSGGAVLIEANSVSLLSITNSRLTGNRADLDGGAIATNGNVTIANSVITGNIAGNSNSGRGGAIYAYYVGMSVSIFNSTVSDNHAVAGNSGPPFGGGGGGIFASSVSVTQHSLVSNNVADDSGGGIFASASVTVYASTVTGNSAALSGGGIYGPAASTADITGSTISGNTAAKSSGGGIYASHITLYDSTVNANHANFLGGGLAGNSLTSKNATISGNQSGYLGGGVGLAPLYANIFADISFTTITANAMTGLAPAGDAGIAVRYFGGSPAAMLMSTTLDYGNTGGYDVGCTGNGVCSLLIIGSSDLVGTHGAATTVPGDTSSCDPQLEPLADNGGPTKTHALPNGSCAIDMGPPSPVGTPFDQRGPGFVRAYPVYSDIGAFEYQPTDIIFNDGFEL